jgi:hypothetical protein
MLAVYRRRFHMKYREWPENPPVIRTLRIPVVDKNLELVEN